MNPHSLDAYVLDVRENSTHASHHININRSRMNIQLRTFTEYREQGDAPNCSFKVGHLCA